MTFAEWGVAHVVGGEGGVTGVGAVTGHQVGVVKQASLAYR